VQQFQIQVLEFRDFEQSYYDSLPQDKALMHLRLDMGKYYTVYQGADKVGIVGYIERKNNHYFQVYIAEKYRGYGILTKMATFIFQEVKNNFYATIDKNNIISYKAHLKAGFYKPTSDEMAKLKLQAKLDENQYILVYKQNSNQR